MRLTFISAATLCTITSILVFGSTTQAAGSATFSAAASPSSVTVGATTTFALYENGTDINVVTGTFSYDTSKLQFVSTSCAGNFSGTANTSSSVASCFVSGGATASGLQLFAHVTFKSITPGSAAFTITGSQIASAGVNIWNGATSSTLITINPVVVSPTPSVAPTAQSTPTPTKATPVPTKTQTAPSTSPVTTPKATTVPAPTITTIPTPIKGQVEGAQTSSSATPTPTATPSPMVESSHSKTPWVIAFIGAIAIMAIAIYFFRSKKAIGK